MGYEDAIERLIRAFAKEVREVLRDEIALEVMLAIRSVCEPSPRGSRKRGRPAFGAFRATSARRTPEEVERLAIELFGYIHAHPGRSAAQIAAQARLKTIEVVAALKKLRVEKQIKASGVGRGTTYSTVT